MRIDEFIQHLDGVKLDSNGYIARCPAHDDTTPSLSISTGESGNNVSAIAISAGVVGKVTNP